MFLSIHIVSQMLRQNYTFTLTSISGHIGIHCDPTCQCVEILTQSQWDHFDPERREISLSGSIWSRSQVSKGWRHRDRGGQRQKQKLNSMARNTTTKYIFELSPFDSQSWIKFCAQSQIPKSLSVTSYLFVQTNVEKLNLWFVTFACGKTFRFPLTCEFLLAKMFWWEIPEFFTTCVLEHPQQAKLSNVHSFFSFTVFNVLHNKHISTLHKNYTPGIVRKIFKQQLKPSGVSSLVNTLKMYYLQ